MKYKIYLILFAIGLWTQIYAQITTAQRHEIVFVTKPGYIYRSWLECVAADWYATGICIQLYWGEIEKTPGKYDMSVLNIAVNAIVEYNTAHPSAKLDIYIRVNFGVGKPTWVNPTNSYMTGGVNDFQVKSDNSIYDYYSDCLYPNNIEPNPTDPGRRHPLNFASENSKKKMFNLYHAVLNSILLYSASTRSIIKEVSPTFSHYEETEYPVHKMCGYSKPEMASFIRYLKNKYSDLNAGLNKLNKRWNPNKLWAVLSSWKDINPQKYSWDKSSGRLYEPGYTDWMDFRTELLANLLSEFAGINSTHQTDTTLGYPKFGVQFGSIYDNAIEYRGWIDPAKIIEVADVVHVADIPIYYNNFNFSADYLRSLCKFFTKYNPSRPRTFTTESNGIEIVNYKYGLDELCKKWADQLDAYNRKGASAHYICDWDFDIPTLIAYKKSLHVWNSKLLAYKNDTTKTPIYGIDNTKAVHLACEYFLWNSNYDGSENPIFPIQKSIMAEIPHFDQAANSWNDDGKKDIITNYMIERYPEYIANYTSNEPAGISFTKTSQYITERAYSAFMKSLDLNIKFANQTWWLNGTNKEIRYPQGIKNEYNEVRSPIPLILLSTKFM